jgi:hypothetical protein
MLSGLANAWQYFFLLGLASTRPDGLVAIVVPYEWVSRPSARELREYVRGERWNVQVYRLIDETFDRVLTSSSITLIDKRTSDARWEFFEETTDGRFKRLPTETARKAGVLTYAKRSESLSAQVRAKRGLSPGTQKVLTLTEGERVRAGLRVGVDVVPCVTTLKALDLNAEELSRAVFHDRYRSAGRKCWLLRTDRKPSIRLKRYLDSVPSSQYQTATCRDRKDWWHFIMPDVPDLLIASGFHGPRPKVVINVINARAVGSVCGIYGARGGKARRLLDRLRNIDLSHAVVPHSHGLKKLEINQLNTLLTSLSWP